MKKQWNIINQKTNGNANEIIKTVLKSRGIKNLDKFLNPSSEDLLPLNLLLHIEEAVDIIVKGIEEQKRFTIFYDSDTDGVSGGEIACSYILNFVPEVNKLHHIGKGHGLIDFWEEVQDTESEDPMAVKKVNKMLDAIIETTDILWIVDSSSNDHVEQNYLKEHGVEIIITDHHESPDNPNICIVNSQFNEYPNPHLSGSGVTWKLALALDERMNTNYAWDYVDLASVGILADVCDISEESYENRFIVSSGLNSLQNMGLSVIVGAYDFTSTAVLWSIAPLINACVRTGNNKLIIDFIAEKDKKKCKKMLTTIKELKIAQDEEVAETVNSVEFQVQSQDYQNNKVVYAFTSDGEFNGLVATKIAEKYGKPCIILNDNIEKNKMYKGSMRGIGIKSFKDVIDNTNLAVYCMGHANASGIGVFPEKFERMIKSINKQLKDVEFKTELDVDIELSPNQITFELAEQLNKLNKISGKGFQPISICLKDCEPSKVIVMQNKHTKFNVGHIEMVKWNDGELGRKLGGMVSMASMNDDIYITLDIIGTLSISKFAGKTNLQIVLSDFQEPQECLSFLR